MFTRGSGTSVFTLGVVRSAIFIVPRVAAALTDDELTATLVHELAHVRRRDNLRRMFGSLAAVAAALVFVEALVLESAFKERTFRFDVTPAASPSRPRS